MKGHPALSGLSMQWITEELAIYDIFPLVVKLSGECGYVGIHILAVYIPPDERQGYINLNATYSDVL